MTVDLQIKDVAERTGIAAGTIRMWEQRYGFPTPRRTGSGYRVYSADDVEALRKVQALRHRGLSMAAAIERAREAGTGPSDHPSIYAAVAGTEHAPAPQLLSKRTLVALSRAIEHEALARAARPVMVGAFQRERFFREVEGRWRRLAAHSDACLAFADFPDVAHRHGMAELPIAPEDAMGNEWAVVADAPGYAACLLAWEHPETPPGEPDGARRFEALWTLDPVAVRRAAEVAATLAGRADPALGRRLHDLLAERPLALEEPAPALTALANRVVAYLEAAQR
jgi:MerR family transcriptional regulator, light-induced transcriptional regulator